MISLTLLKQNKLVLGDTVNTMKNKPPTGRKYLQTTYSIKNLSPMYE